MNIFILWSVFNSFMMVIGISIPTPINRLLINNLLLTSVHILKGYLLMIVNIKLVALNSWSAWSLYSHLILIFIYFFWVHMLDAILRWFMNWLFLFPTDSWIIIHKSIIFLIYSNISNYISLVFKFILIDLNVIPYQSMRQLLVLIIT